MPFINPDDLPSFELFPGIVVAIASGEKLMLSFLNWMRGLILQSIVILMSRLV